jgi:ribosomal protein L32
MKSAVILVAMGREQDGAKLHHDARSQKYNGRRYHAVFGKQLKCHEGFGGFYAFPESCGVQILDKRLRPKAFASKKRAHRLCARCQKYRRKI